MEQAEGQVFFLPPTLAERMRAPGFTGGSAQVFRQFDRRRTAPPVFAVRMLHPKETILRFRLVFARQA